jgi:predicted Zn-dependent peptidase
LIRAYLQNRYFRNMAVEDYSLHVLPNGLRVAYKKVSGTRLVHCGYIIGAGSRNDGDHPGLAHCLEHMLFKGTTKRRTIHVLNHLEVVGGEMNAFTTKELTAIYATVQSGHYGRATDILNDVTWRSNIPEAELVKEKKVIADEINMYLDTPEENIFDEFQEQLFGKHPLAHNILGTEESVKGLERQHILDFTHTHYHSGNLVYVVVGNISLSRALLHAEKYSEGLRIGKTEVPAKSTPKYSPQSITKDTDFTQAYAIMGLPAYAENHPKRWTMLMLNNLLGGPGMNSRLNLAIREKYGYTYHIESGYQSYYDSGMFHCYLSAEQKYIERSCRLIERELEKLKKVKLGTLQLSRARNQFMGQIVMADENRSGLLVHIGKGILRHGRAISLKEVLDNISAVRAEDLMEVANEIFDLPNMSYLTYLPE